VQMTSAVMTGGFGVVSEAIETFADYITKRDQTAEDLIGRAADLLAGYQTVAADTDRWRELFAGTGRPTAP